MTTPAEHIRTAVAEALAAVDDITDTDSTNAAIQRDAAVRAVLEALADGVLATKAARRENVQHLKEGRTLKQVGDLLGLSLARVDQILKGK